MQCRQAQFGRRGLATSRAPKRRPNAVVWRMLWGVFPDKVLLDTGKDLIQEPLNAPFLNGLFSRGFSRGETAHQGIRDNGP